MAVSRGSEDHSSAPRPHVLAFRALYLAAPTTDSLQPWLYCDGHLRPTAYKSFRKIIPVLSTLKNVIELRTLRRFWWVADKACWSTVNLRFYETRLGWRRAVQRCLQLGATSRTRRQCIQTATKNNCLSIRNNDPRVKLQAHSPFDEGIDSCVFIFISKKCLPATM